MPRAVGIHVSVAHSVDVLVPGVEDLGLRDGGLLSSSVRVGAITGRFPGMSPAGAKVPMGSLARMNACRTIGAIA